MSVDRISSSRELFLRIMNFKPCNRTLNWEFGYWGGTLNRWYHEGLPKVKGLSRKPNFGQAVPGEAVAAGSPSFGGSIPEKDFDVNNYFNFDNGFTLVPYNYWIYPSFKKEILFEDDRFIDFFDVDGIRKKVFKDDSSMPLWLEWPIKNAADWEMIKEERFNLDTISKRFQGNLENFIKESKYINSPFGILDAPCGFFGSLRFLLGEMNLFMFYYDNPKLINDILNHLCEFWISIAEELTSRMNFDIACFWEDMAGRQGSLVSPVIFREFMTPRYKKLIDFLRLKGISHFLVDTDGKIDQLIPLFLETGITVIYPFEQQADNDLIKIREKYPNLGMIGGFDKNTLYKGKEYINRELKKIPYLISKGGFIPCADHLIPPNCSWEDFKYYRYKLKNVIDKTKVL